MRLRAFVTQHRIAEPIAERSVASRKGATSSRSRSMSGGLKRLVPLMDRVLVSRVEPLKKSVGGVILPDSAVSKVRNHALPISRAHVGRDVSVFRRAAPLAPSPRAGGDCNRPRAPPLLLTSIRSSSRGVLTYPVSLRPCGCAAGQRGDGRCGRPRGQDPRGEHHSNERQGEPASVL